MFINNEMKVDVNVELAETIDKLTSIRDSMDYLALEQIEDGKLQSLIELLLKIYAQKVQVSDQNLVNHEGEGIVKPLTNDNKLSQTDTVIFVDQLLKQKDIELFEVQMFRSIG
ncbi:hypothetical protein ACJROX_25290 [Pseudalkalibacillus sp. A8]|uniref:hypothetical protein n=1 Tax=Pseudalkalibacillus sp. A8 TaxID=3382641 RepID=UPI0038B656A1